MELSDVCRKILKNSLDLKAGETFLIVTDDAKKRLAEALYRAGQAIGAETLLIVMKERQRSGEEPPRAVAATLIEADAAVLITEFSLTHTRARKRAVEAGTRLATMPGITEDMFLQGAITADYSEVKALTERITGLLDRGRRVLIEKGGQRLAFSIEGRKGVPSTGVYIHSGESGNLPSGEAFIAPVEGTASGRILVDGSVVGVGKLKSSLLLTVKDGRLVEAEGEGAERLLELLGTDLGRSVAEFGIGTNRSARITGNVLEDEKVYGTVHIAFGSNLTFGGTIEAGVHIDCVFKDPDVKIDGCQVMKNGRMSGTAPKR